MIARTLAALLLLIALGAAPAQAASAVSPDDLQAGAGQADITPPKLGYFLGGWTRADRVATGQSTRLYANTLVLQRGGTKVALVAAELFAIPAGLQADVAKGVANLGYTRASVLLAASHTHSGPGGFANNPTYNTAAPSPGTATDPFSFARLFNPPPADRQLYTFLVQQMIKSIQRADADRGPARAGWGHTELTGLTQNRSIEAHLADHGIHLPYGKGSADMDPDGEAHTIDPGVDVLRVDKLVRRAGRTVARPIGAYSTFADHGTVVKSETQAYSGDHHASAWRVFTRLVRDEGHVPRQQTIVNVYPNADEGDQTAGLQHSGIDGAKHVGRVEAQAMFQAWREAGAHLSRRPALDLRWTVSCFCGRETSTGKVDTQGRVGIGFLTGSEEGRGPLYDVTQTPLEGVTSPADDPIQGDKIVFPAAGPANAVPVGVYRIGDGVLLGVPGEATKEVGVRMRGAALDALAGTGVTHAVIAGLADDYIQYVTTPEEYGQQSYEGASTLFGKNEATFLQERLGELAAAMKAGRPAPEPYDIDPSYGVRPDGPPYDGGAASGALTTQPADTEPGGVVDLAWNGGPQGTDRPVDRAFVLVQHRVKGTWVTTDVDTGLDMLWRSDDQGHYTLQWDVRRDSLPGTYRMLVAATKYTLTSQTFTMR